MLDFEQGAASAARQSDLYGVYAQSGMFLHEIVEGVPEELEVAFRYATVTEPNRGDVTAYNQRQEFTPGLNWFFAGHNNKLTLDYSYLTLVDGVSDDERADHRARLQWDVSF